MSNQCYLQHAIQEPIINETPSTRNKKNYLKSLIINHEILCFICSLVNFIVEIIMIFYYEQINELELALSIIQILLCLLSFAYNPTNNRISFTIEMLISLSILESFIENPRRYSSFFLIYAKVLHSMIVYLNQKVSKKELIVTKSLIIIYFSIRIFIKNKDELQELVSNIQLCLCVVFIVYFDKSNSENSEQTQKVLNDKQKLQNEKIMNIEESFAEIHNVSKSPILGINNKHSNRVINELSSQMINCLQVPQNQENRNLLGTGASSLLSGSMMQSFQNQSYNDISKGSNKLICRKFNSIQKMDKTSSSFLRNVVITQQKVYTKECFEADILSQLYIGILAIDYKKKIIYQNSCIKQLFDDQLFDDLLDTISKQKISNSKSERDKLSKHSAQNGIDFTNSNIQEENEKEGEISFYQLPNRRSYANRQSSCDEAFKKTLQKAIFTSNNTLQVEQNNKVSLRKSIWQKKNISLFDNLENKDESISSCSSSDDVEDISTIKKMQTFGNERLSKTNLKVNIEDIQNKKMQHRKSSDNQCINQMYGKLVKNDDLSNNNTLVNALNNKETTIETIIDILLDKNYWKDKWRKFIIHSESELSSINQNNFKITEPKTIEGKMNYQIKENSVILQVSLKTDKKNQEKPFYIKLSSYMAEKSVVSRRNSSNQNNKIRMILLIELIPLQNILSCIQESDITNFKNKIISSLSHELRTPLNCCIQMLEMLYQSDCCNVSSQMNQTSNIHNGLNSPKSLLHQQNYLVSEDVKKMFITPALNSSYLLLSMINDIIDFAQLNNGRLSLNFNSFQIRDLVKECISLFTLPATIKNLQLLFNLDPSVPPIIHSDPNRVKQVLLALLSNALKFTEKGFIQVNVNQIQPELIKITVTDSGCGIPSELKSRIFRGLSSTGFKQTKKSGVFRSSISNSNPASKLTNGLVNTSTSIRKSQVGCQLNQKSSHLNPSCLMGEDFSDSNEYWAKREEGLNNLTKSSVIENEEFHSSFNKNSMNTQGAGLGLTIANHLAQGLGGNRSMIVESELNKGSSFHFYVVNHPVKSKGCKLNQRNTFDIQYYIWKSIHSEQSNMHSALSQQSCIGRGKSNELKDGELTSQPSYKGQHQIKNQESYIDQSSMAESNVDAHSQNSRYLSKQFEHLQEEEEEDEDEQDILTDTDSCNVQTEKLNIHDSEEQSNVPQSVSIIVTQKKQNNTILSPTQISTNNTQSFKHQRNMTIFKQLENTKCEVLKEDKISDSDLKQLANLNSQTHSYQSYDREILALQDNFRLFLASSFTNLQTNLSTSHNQQTQNSLNQITSMNFFRLNPNDSGSNQSMVFNQIQRKKQKQLTNQRNSYTNSKSCVDQQKEKRRSVDAMQFMMNNNKNLSETNLPNNNNNVSQESLEHTLISSKDIGNNNPIPQPNLSIQQQLQALNNNRRCNCNQILIVDDNEFNLLTLEMRLLRQYYFKVDKAFSGNLAIEMIIKRLEESNCCKTYTFIFMDIDMPIKNGHQTTKEILKIFQNKKIRPPIISACTAFGHENERQKAKQSGMMFFITKPIEITLLESALSFAFLQN